MVEAVEAAAGETAIETEQSKTTARPYPPSWLNYLRTTIGARPGPNWAYYLGLGVLLIAVESAFRWYEGVDPLWTVNRLFATNALIIGGILILLEHLDKVACSALERFRPVLAIEGMLAYRLPDASQPAGRLPIAASTGTYHSTLDNAQYESLCYQLTTLPARPALLISATSALGMGFQAITGGIAYFQPARLYMAPLSGTVDLLMAMLIAGVLGAFIFHAIWQLRLMHRIYSDNTRVHLFDISPLYAFSRLTAHTAIGLVLLAYTEILVFPEGLRASLDFAGLSHYGLIIFTIAIAMVTFIWPLFGVHRLLVEEKERRHADLAQRLDAAISELQRPLEAAQLGHLEVTRRKEALDTLVLAESEIVKIPTWPWRTGTLGGLATTILLPLLIWFITRLLGHLIP